MSAMDYVEEAFKEYKRREEEKQAITLEELMDNIFGEN